MHGYNATDIWSGKSYGTASAEHPERPGFVHGTFHTDSFGGHDSRFYLFQPLKSDDEASGSAVGGLTLHTFNNTALAGEPMETIVRSLSLSFVETESFSAEVFGRVTFPAAGRYNIECNING